MKPVYLKYQDYADSPGVKSYTNWSVYDRVFQDYLAGRTGLVLAEEKPSVSAEIVFNGATVFQENIVSKEKGIGLIPVEGLVEKIHYESLIGAAWLEPAKPVSMVASVIPQDAKGLAPQHLVIHPQPGFEGGVLLDIYASPQGTVRTLFIEALLEEDSRLWILLNYNGRSMGGNIVKLAAKLGKGSELVIASIGAAGVMDRFEGEVVLEGEGSRCIYRMGVAGVDGGRADYITGSLHLGRNTVSRVLYTGVSGGGAFIAHRGRARITEDAEWSNTSFDTHILIAGDGGFEAGSPALEIDTGNVAAARHGVRVERINYDKVFYLSTRGLLDDEAVQLILYGFLMRETEDLPEELVSRYSARAAELSRMYSS